jgi:hypothetical protein
MSSSTLALPVRDGTYSVHNGWLHDYASRWSGGYIVATHALQTLDYSNPVDIAITAMNDKVRLIGVWTDSETGRVYLDAVEHIESRSDALRIAAERGELAIWDLYAKAEIRL